MKKPEFVLKHDDCYFLDDRVVEVPYDVAVTSPPYNIEKKDAGKFEVSMSDDKYLDWLIKRLRKVMDALHSSGSLFLNIAGKPSKPQLPYKLVVKMLEEGYALQNVIHWVKSISLEVDGEMKSQGHFKPINSKRFVNDLVEPIFHFTKSGDVQLDRLAVGVPYQDKSNVSRWEAAMNDKRCRGNVWFIPYETRREKGEHPTPFPLDLPRMCIRLHGKKNPRVLDPFLGSGTTAEAAAKENASAFLGFDLAEEAIDMSYLRLTRPNYPVKVLKA